MTGGVWVASYVLLWIAVLALALVCVALLRQVGVLHARLRPLGVHFSGEGPELGSRAPFAERFAYPEATVTVVAFTSKDCTICRELVPAVERLARQYADDVRIRFVEHDPDTLEVFDAFNVRSTPYFVGVDASGTVRARGVGNALEQVEELVEEALAPEDRRVRPS